MQSQELLKCMVSAWYPRFRDVTFRTQLVDLPEEFVAFLVEDGVSLAENSAALPRRARADEFADVDEYQEWDEADVDQAEAATQVENWPELMRRISDAITELGGQVIPKLSWSVPKDATWISANKSLICENAEEVVLLLKSSDRIAHDICHAFDGCTAPPCPPPKHTLALRKAYDLKPEREFRCFVKGNDLIGVSQRDITSYYPQLRAQQEELMEIILEFFEEHLEHRFPSADYVVDLYVATNGKVRIVDFNPPGGTTSPLLFSWEELAYASPQAPPELASSSFPQPCSSSGILDFRIITEPINIQPHSTAYAMPYDLVDSAPGSAVNELMRQARDADGLFAAMPAEE
ncbi:hypothetical protein WJX72_010569 [[Myrmecia] bisecta]|uniref:Cell division cycle protein 123 n=1 Tax=[Myrmecia] bisecta TaxID=41462 RepID=A0AAW1PKX2_9CHLO